MFSDDEDAAGVNDISERKRAEPMVSDDEGAAAVKDLDVEVAMLLRDFETITRRAGLRPRDLKCRLRDIGILEQDIALCQTRSDLLELLLFAKIPSKHLAQRAESSHTRSHWVVLLLAIAALLLSHAEDI